MRGKLLIPVVAAGLLGLAGCVVDGLGLGERFSKDFHYSYPLKDGGRLSIETFNGSVDISGWDEPTVDISGTKYGPSSQAADSLPIETDHLPDSVSIRVVRPSTRWGPWGARFQVKMPRRAVVELIRTSNGQIHVLDGAGPSRLRSSNGAIRLEGLQGDVDAQTSNGMVELVDVTGNAVVHTSNGRIRADHLQGSLQANTSNGTISASLSGTAGRPLRLDTSNGGVDATLPQKFDSDVRIHTSNGHITLRLPAEANARVEAQTSNSGITSDFEVRAQGAFSKNRLDGTIGTGGPLLDLSTSNAGIRLVKM
jgi:hypothetical protein